MKPGPTTVDEYMAAIENAEFRAALEDLRNLIREELPNAEERISYGMPSYKLKGSICHFAAFAKHCSFFPGGVALDYAVELAGHKLSKGTIQFTPDKPLNPELVRKMIRRNVEADKAKKSR